MLFGDVEPMTRGEVLTSILGTATALYVLWEKLLKGLAESRRAKLSDDEQRLKLDAMAQASMAAAYDEVTKARKAAHDADIARLTSDIADSKMRLAELESREAECQQVCAGLKSQNTQQAQEITDLRAKIEGLEAKLRAAGAIPPATGDHKPLG